MSNSKLTIQPWPRRGIYHPKKAGFPKATAGEVGGGGGLDKEMPGCISSPHVWLQRQLAAGLCPPTPGKEVKPQESSKQVKA